MILWRLHLRRSGRTGHGPALDVHALLVYIHDHLAEPIRLEDLARIARLSVTHFSRLFGRIFGVSPMRYVMQRRVGLAQSLLLETSMPVKQVAHAVGCEDPYYFSRMFSKVVGVGPSAYRQRHRREGV
jgi:AraC-like DNA-binding protein